MEHNNSTIRRQDRLLEKTACMQLLAQGEYGILSMVKETGEAYGIPISYAWDGDRAIYLHCAPEGEKLRCIAHNKNVSFCVIGNTQVIPPKFTTAYESVVLACTAHADLDAPERMHALELILKKYTPNHLELGLTYAEKSFHRTAIIKLDILRISGKCKRP